MKHVLICISLFVITAGNAICDSFYDADVINSIEIIFEENNWDEILDILYAEGEDRLVGTVKINGAQYDSVGVRYKGNSSYNARQNKNPLNIKLDHIIDDQEHEGFGTLKLANGCKDPSFVREVLSYEIARDYMPAGLANFCKVFINGTYIGLYTSVQDVDKHFLRMHYNGSDNPFFKGELVGGDRLTSVKVWGYFGADSTSYHNYYELESDNGWADLIHFLDILNNEPDSVEDVLNVDRHLWMLAYDILMVNLDSPVNFGHNYYLYKDSAGRFNPVIWDLNENFGLFSSLVSGAQLDVVGMQQMDLFLNATNTNYPIIEKILTNPSYKKMYVAHMKTIIDEHFDNGQYRTRALELQDIIDSEVQNDPNTFFTYTEFKDGVDGSSGENESFDPRARPGQPGQPGQSSVGITQLMDGRIAFLNAQYEFQATAPVIGSIGNSPVQVSPNTDVWLIVEALDADMVRLHYRYNQTEAFGSVEMLDDGAHNDGAAGDGVFGVSIPAGSSGFHYYFYAENDAAGTFSPARAAYEFYSLPVSGAIVINEFMASNDATMSDQDGEYDDWIELFNNSGNEISLAGYHLTDDLDDLTKWAFPDTSIGPGEYLVIWADGDEEQSGVHTNFKLDASGESLALVDPELVVVDELIFGGQTSDMSMCRCPNGTGSFVEMNPTFAAQNLDIPTAVDDWDEALPADFELMQNFPNPFNPTTTIQYSIPSSQHVRLNVYNANGQLVSELINKQMTAGTHQVVFDGKDLSSGMYFYKIDVGVSSKTGKMLFIK